ncbi:uncharacterized protein LOC111889284 [Lactuca sativa]|uniref:SWIM-type domain-containing protein n=1 Tax=Lactuca sativa TaxID=4236 RepID=A0A9R1X1R5_LACSA|nr:uncharacterized protein LOC111889284 [Lactuca sativa]KAJ0197365.1 hypothetical protein LSAT_V11C700362950 [Lactuca sativa]
MRNPRPKIRRAQLSDEMEKGPYYDSDFEESELESESYNESERAFVVDDELVIREEGQSDNESEDDEDEVDQKPTKYSVHDPSVHWKKMKPHLGEKYANQTELRFYLTNYAVHNGYPIEVTKSSSTRRCNFKLWASWMNKEKSFQIKGLNNKHTCVRVYKHATLRQCYRAKKKAHEILTGKLSEHYARIWEYGGEIIRSNPGIIAKVGVDIKEDGSNVFKRFYVCFKAIKDGWIRGCKRVIGLDGCFLKGQCKGELLTAIGRDGNNQVYPIAWVVIDVENKDNWEWFIKLLVEGLGLELGEGLTVISGQHKGLVEALKEKLPLVEHRQCARHVYVNFKKVYNGIDYKRHFWAASMSTTESSFLETMEELKEMNGGAYDHLMERNPESWSRAFYKEGRACEAVENGISESFNSVILEARTNPLLTMLEELRMYVMERFYRMSTIHLTWRGDVFPTILTKLDDLFKDMRLWSVVASDTNVFEVRLGFEYFQVDLGEQFCTCRLWEISRIPCIHACAAMNHTQQQPETLISSWFSKEKFVETYKGNIRPLNGSKCGPGHHMPSHCHHLQRGCQEDLKPEEGNMS